MVAAISTSSTTPRAPKAPPSTPHHRPPLSPSEKTNHSNNNADDDDSISSKPRSKPRTSPSSSSSNSIPKRSQPNTTTTRSLSVSFQGQSFSLHTTKPKPISPTQPKKLSARIRQPNSPAKTVAAVRVLGNSVVFDDRDAHLSSDSDRPGSEKGRGAARGVSVPARFWPENFGHARRKSMDTHLTSPSTGSPSPVMGKLGNAPSTLSLAAESRRVKKGESRIEEAHSLRLLHNRYLQWRLVSAQADAVLSMQRTNVEKNSYDAWLATSELSDSVTCKRIKMQLLMQNLKLASIVKGQVIYVEEWSLMDKEHSNYLSGLITALKASTLRLPVVSGARVDIQELQNAVGSAVDLMQAMGTSICSLLSKLEGTSTSVLELAKAAAHERALLDQTKYLLSTVAALHVKQCSLQGHILQRHRSQLNLQPQL